jgi:hypothetical protein
LRMVNRVLAPPSSPALIRPGTTHRPEHVSTHNPGANIAEAARGKVVVDAGLSVFASEQVCLKRASGERPSMQGSSADSKRVLQGLIRACAKAIEMVKLSTRSLVICLFPLLQCSGKRVPSSCRAGEAQRIPPSAIGGIAPAPGLTMSRRRAIRSSKALRPCKS